MNREPETQSDKRFRVIALRIVLVYLAVGLLWIIGSDAVLHALVNDPRLENDLQSAKGVFYIIATAAGLYYLIRSGLSTLQAHGQALAKSESRYRTLVEQASDGIFIADLDGKLIEASARGCEMLGYTRDDLLKLKVTDLFAEEMDPQPESLHRLRAGQVVTSERTMRRKDGSVFPAEISTKLLPDGTLQGIARDVSKRKRAEQELVASETRYRTLVETMNEGIIVVDTEDRIEYVNGRLCEMLGYEREDLIGKRRRDVLVDDEPDREILITQSRLGLRDIADRYELRMRKKSGEHIWVAASGASIHDGDGNIIGSITIHSDITERKADRQRILEYAESQADLLSQLITAQEAERRRLQMDIHDGPLQSLGVSILSLERALKQYRSGDQGRAQDELLSLRSNLVGIVGELRAVLADLSLEMLSTQGLASALRDHIRRFSDLTGIKVEMQETLQERLSAEVEILFYRLAQESLSNIRKHSGATQAGITLGMEGEEAVMKIHDNGKGFDVEQAMAARQSGVGIGLRSMLKRVSDAHGRLSIESVEGSGTSLVFRCPMPARVDAREEQGLIGA